MEELRPESSHTNLPSLEGQAKRTYREGWPRGLFTPPVDFHRKRLLKLVTC